MLDSFLLKPIKRFSLWSLLPWWIRKKKTKSLFLASNQCVWRYQLVFMGRFKLILTHDRFLTQITIYGSHPFNWHYWNSNVLYAACFFFVREYNGTFDSIYNDLWYSITNADHVSSKIIYHLSCNCLDTIVQCTWL